VIDVNASTPRAKRLVAEAVAANGGAYVDANLMGAVSIYGAAVPLYSSGDGAAAFAEVFTPLGFTIELAGTAAAVKMLRSVVTKGKEALIVEALTAASMAGVRTEALRGICEPMDATRYSKFVVRADRRAARAAPCGGNGGCRGGTAGDRPAADHDRRHRRTAAGIGRARAAGRFFRAAGLQRRRCARCLCRKVGRPLAPVAFAQKSREASKWDRFRSGTGSSS
jgi:hypothetical protein